MNFIKTFRANWKAPSRNIWGFSIFPKIGKILGVQYENKGSSAILSKQ